MTKNDDDNKFFEGLATPGRCFPSQLTSAAAGVPHSAWLPEPGSAKETQGMTLGQLINIFPSRIRKTKSMKCFKLALCFEIMSVSVLSLLLVEQRN